jgi:superfamily II DNA or RNA helicase
MMTTIYQLRDYQQELIDRIFTHWHQGRRRVMAQLPTGGGKTIAIGEITRQFTHNGGRVLILAHREELVKQAADKVGTIAGLPTGIIKAGFKPEPLFPIQVASVQTLVNRLDRVGDFDLVVIDEAHHSTASTYRSILNRYPQSYLLGVTATPIRLDGSGFRDLFDELVCGVTVTSLIHHSHLSRFKLYADPDPMTTKGARKSGGDFSAGDVARLNDALELSGNLLDSYTNHANGKSCVVFAVNVEHSQMIADRYNQAGIRAIHLDGTTPSHDRSAALDRFKRGEIKVISNCALFDEGLDLPALEAVQIAKPTNSLSRWLQMVGRALRVADGKEHAIVIDHTKNWAIHGLPTHPRVWALDGVESRQVKLTRQPNGEVVDRPEPLEIVEVVQGRELVEISERDALDTAWRSELQRLFTQQQTRGYKPSWVFFRLKESNPPLEIWQQYATKMGYKQGWAWHTWKSIQVEREQGVSA